MCCPSWTLQILGSKLMSCTWISDDWHNFVLPYIMHVTFQVWVLHSTIQWKCENRWLDILHLQNFCMSSTTFAALDKGGSSLRHSCKLHTFGGCSGFAIGPCTKCPQGTTAKRNERSRDSNSELRRSMGASFYSSQGTASVFVERHLKAFDHSLWTANPWNALKEATWCMQQYAQNPFLMGDGSEQLFESCVQVCIFVHNEGTPKFCLFFLSCKSHVWMS